MYMRISSPAFYWIGYVILCIFHCPYILKRKVPVVKLNFYCMLAKCFNYLPDLVLTVTL